MAALRPHLGVYLAYELALLPVNAFYYHRVLHGLTVRLFITGLVHTSCIMSRGLTLVTSVL